MIAIIGTATVWTQDNRRSCRSCDHRQGQEYLPYFLAAWTIMSRFM